MNTSEQYHRPVLEALCAFVRDGAKAKIIKNKTEISTNPESPATDIQAALTVIGRRAPSGVELIVPKGILPGVIDLSSAYVPRATLTGNLTGAFLAHATLTAADLTGANLTAADLTGANLTGATLTADLTYAVLMGANLTGANLTYATGLSQDQLDAACGDKDTKLPSGITIKPCQ
jgi:Pentapeptide repeats (8 copies)